jgi:hypothetical protein
MTMEPISEPIRRVVERVTADRQFCDDVTPPYDRTDETEWDDEPYDPDEEFLDYECGMMHDGQCSKAGSEECDWECPRSR